MSMLVMTPIGKRSLPRTMTRWTLVHEPGRSRRQRSRRRPSACQPPSSPRANRRLRCRPAGRAALGGIVQRVHEGVGAPQALRAQRRIRSILQTMPTARHPGQPPGRPRSPAPRKDGPTHTSWLLARRRRGHRGRKYPRKAEKPLITAQTVSGGVVRGVGASGRENFPAGKSRNRVV